MGPLSENLDQNLVEALFSRSSERFFLRALAHAHEDLAGYFQRPCEDLVDVLVMFLPQAVSLTLFGVCCQDSVFED